MSKNQQTRNSSAEKGKKGPAKPQKRPQQGFFRRNVFSITLFLMCFVVFGNGIFNEYALDDEFYTNGANKLTQKGFSGIPEIFKTRTFYNNDGSGYSYRPVTLTAFAIEIQFFGEQPHVSHFINLLLYALTMVLLFQLLRRWFSAQGDWFSFLVCALFLIHPIHTEVVDNIKCRDELLAFLFCVLSLLFMWKHHETSSKIYLFLSPLSFFLAMLSKHTAIPFIALAPLALWFFMDTSWINRILLYTLPLVLAALAVVLMQKTMLPPQVRTYQAFENPLPGHPGLGKLTATGFYVLGRYIGLLFVPFPLVYYYGFSYIPLADWTNIISILSLLVHLGLGLLALRELRRKSILGFGLIFYLVNIAAYSNLLQPAPGLMAERFAYSASLGFCIVIVLLLFRLFRIEPAEFKWSLEPVKKLRAVFIVIGIVFTVLCWSRNEDWENKEVLYAHDIEYTHESAKANMLLGALRAKAAMERRLAARSYKEKGMQYAFDTAYASAKRLFEESRGYYKKATEIAPYYYTAWSNLGTTYFFLETDADTSNELTKQALVYFKKSITLKPGYSEGLFNTAMSYERLGDIDSAIYYFNRSISSDSAYLSSYEQLSRVYLQHLNQPDKAMSVLQTAARKKPDSDAPWNDIGNLYLQLKDTASAAGAFEMAAKINPNNPQRLYNLAGYFYKKGDMEKFNYYNGLLKDLQEKMQKNGQMPVQQQQRRR